MQNKLFDNFVGFMTPIDGDKHWKKVNVDTIKVNIDMVIFSRYNRFKYPFVTRNRNDALVETGTRCVEDSLSQKNYSIYRDKGGSQLDENTELKNVRSSNQRIFYLKFLIIYFDRVMDECKTLSDNKLFY